MQNVLQRITGRGVAFFRDLAVLVGGQVVSKLLGFAAFAWLARALDPVGYGAVEYVVGLLMFFAMIVDGGMDVVGTRRATRDPDQLPVLAHQIPALRLMLAVVSVPVMAVAAFATMRETVPAVLILLFAASLLTVPWRQQWLFQTTRRMTTIANAEIIRMVIFAAAVWMLVGSPADIVYVGWAEVAAVTAMTAYYAFVQQKRITPIGLTRRVAGFGGLLREGAAVSSANFVWALAQFAPLFLVANLLGGVETAWFAGAARVTSSIGQFSNIYHFNLYPAVSAAHTQGRDALGSLLVRSLRVTAWGGVLVALTLCLFAYPLIGLTLGPKLLEAAPILQVMVWLIPIMLWSGHCRWALAAAGAQRLVLISQILGLGVTVAACVGIGHFHGSIGYAYGLLVGALAVWAASHRFARQQECEPPSPAIIIRPLGFAILTMFLVHHFALGFWQMALTLVGFMVLAPLVDRALPGDVALLGATRHRGGSA